MPKLTHKDVPRVVLLGRTNVGKSTLFSRITYEDALISRTPHTTRDAKEVQTEWNGVHFDLVDTGGFDIGDETPYAKEVSSTIDKEISRAHTILLVSDSERLAPSEMAWLKHFQKTAKRVLIVANKQDRANTRSLFPIAHVKGVPVFPVSSVNGGGVGDLLDVIVEPFEKKEVLESRAHFRLGLIGRTNVGKSAIFNALVGEQKAIVSDADHTTRDSQKALVGWSGGTIEVVDTAGAQKKAKHEVNVLSQKITMQVIETCDVLALVIEAGMHPIPRQDMELVRIALDQYKSVIIVVNKWDTMDDKSPRGRLQEERRIKETFSFAPFAPIAFVSARTNHRIPNILELAKLAYEERFHELDSEQLKAVQKKLSEHVRVIKQLNVDPPRFHSICTERSVPKAITDILQKEIRAQHPYAGTPLIVSLAKKGRRNETRQRTR